MNTCKTCKLWQRVEMCRLGDVYNAGGLCHNELITEDWGRDSYKLNALVYPYDEGAGPFWTGPDFGCVNHQEKA